MKYLTFTTLLLASLLTKAQYSDSLTKALLNAEFSFWQADNDSLRFMALLQKMNLYRYSEHYQQALTEADRAENYSYGNKEKAQLKYERMINSFLLDRYRYCSTQSFDSTEVSGHSKEIEYMLLYSMDESENWSKCKNEMIKYLDKPDSMAIKKIMNLPVSYNYKSPEKSKRLSTFLPGLGEVYSGYPVKGITSFVLNAGFLAFAGYNFYLNYYVTGYVSGILPMLKFYWGGRRLSSGLAERHNEQQENKIKKLYRDELSILLK
jgi:hypothetical protein